MLQIQIYTFFEERSFCHCNPIAAKLLTWCWNTMPTIWVCCTFINGLQHFFYLKTKRNIIAGLEAMVLSKMSFSQSSDGSGSLWTCLECCYQSRYKGDMRKHVETKHFILSFPCSLCTKVLKSTKALRRHMSHEH